MTGGGAVTARATLRGAVTEAWKVCTVRRNVVGVLLAVVVVVVQPWAFLAAFGWMAQEGVQSSSFEVLGLTARNQVAGFLLLLLLGQQAYVSDAGHGLLQPAVAGLRGRLGTAADKLLFGVLTAALLALVATASAAVASTMVGPGVGGRDVPPGFWPWAWTALTLAFALYYLIGLLIAAVVRSKALSVVSAVALVWVVIPAVLTGAGMTSTAATALRWLLPTELAAATLAWVPGGNRLVGEAGLVEARALLLVAWLLALAATWLLVIKRRQLFPSDPS